MLVFALRNRWLVVGLSLLLMGIGYYCFMQLKIEAYPDIADTNVIVVAQYPGRATEEVELQVTVPIERALQNTPNVLDRRSRTIFGLSVVQLTFEDGTDDYFARQQVLERLSAVELPEGVVPELAPLSTAVGEIYRYAVEAPPSFSPIEVRDMQDWIIKPYLLQTKGVADIVTFGGPLKQFQVLVDPDKLRKYDLTIADVEQAIIVNNQNTGGNIIERGGQGFAVRGLGTLKSEKHIENIVLKSEQGVPVFLRDVAGVEIAPPPPSGVLGYTVRSEGLDVNNGVEGIVLLRRYENPSEVLRELQDRMHALQEAELPEGVRLRTLYDRSFLIDHSLETVGKTLFEGVSIVIIILIFFLGSLRSALVVALTIPFSLLFAFILMRLVGIPANLLSLGAIDFGIIVDGACVMVEHLLRRYQGLSPEQKREGIVLHTLSAAKEVSKEIFFSVSIIILAYMPILLMTRVEGKLFSPMALTLSFAVIGSMLAALTLVPVLLSFVFQRSFAKAVQQAQMQPPAPDAPDEDGIQHLPPNDDHSQAPAAAAHHAPAAHGNFVLRFIERVYGWFIRKILKYTKTTTVLGFGLVLFLISFGGSLGTEFLPELDEGSIFLRGNFPAGITIQENAKYAPRIRQIIADYPQISYVISQTGRNDDGTDPFPTNRNEILVGLKDYHLWSDTISKKELVRSIRQDLERALPGVRFSSGQPIIDQVMEIVTGSAADLAVSIVGDDLVLMRAKADSIADIVLSMTGSESVNIEQEGSQDQLAIDIDYESAARYGINVADIQNMIEAAIGGKNVSVVYDGTKRYDIVIRYLPQFRSHIDDIRRLLVPSAGGALIPMSQLARIEFVAGQTNIYRYNNKRMVTVRTNIRGRDQGGFVRELQERIGQNIEIPKGYELVFGGQYENLERAGGQLMLTIPLTIVLVFVLLFMLFRNWSSTLLTMTCILFALAGGIWALLLRGFYFNVSAGVGFVSIFGISVMAGVLLVSAFNRAALPGRRLSGTEVAAVACEQLRALLSILALAILGLIPAAISTGIGSDVQRPLATVIIGGLTSTLIFAPLLLPPLYRWVCGKKD